MSVLAVYVFSSFYSSRLFLICIASERFENFSKKECKWKETTSDKSCLKKQVSDSIGRVHIHAWLSRTTCAVGESNPDLIRGRDES